MGSDTQKKKSKVVCKINLPVLVMNRVKRLCWPRKNSRLVLAEVILSPPLYQLSSIYAILFLSFTLCHQTSKDEYMFCIITYKCQTKT